MLAIYNTLSRKKEPFEPINKNEVRLYVCGITVYDFCHLGHARMLISFDVIQRWLRINGYSVHYVRNITDIDDKIIRRAVQTQRSIQEVTAFYIDAMHADERSLNVLTPDQEPRATEHVSAMLDIIKRLEDQGLAYQAENGDVNYAVRQFADYGKLSGRDLDDLRAGERVAIDTPKRDPFDFVLWKSAKAEEPEETKWPSAYGTGRPGWHIECSAMSHALLGLPLDIHGGGPDLKFPHHENEIAQSEGAFHTPLAKYWMHCGPLMVDADKMSKSLGNFHTIRSMIAPSSLDENCADYLPNPREAEMLRFFIVRNQYRSSLNYALTNLIDAQSALDRLYQTLLKIEFKEQDIDWQNAHAQAFKVAMDDDFNTAGAMAVLFELASQVNRNADQSSAALLKALAGLLGLLQQNPVEYFKSPTRYGTSHLTVNSSQASHLTDQDINAFIAQRAQAKQKRNFTVADEIRANLRQAGIELEDRPDGQTDWRRT